MKYNIIVAMCNERGIGIKNKLPWNLPGDLRRFSKLTIGNNNNAIIMGKNTWLSLPKKPLPKRDNLILSTTLQMSDIQNNTDASNNTYIFNNVNDCLKHCKDKYETVWIIGGQQIYDYFIKRNIIDYYYVTFIDKEFYCDTFFPDIQEDYLLVKNEKLWSKKYNSNYFYQMYKKIKIGEYYFYKHPMSDVNKVCRLCDINIEDKPHTYTIEIGLNKYKIHKKYLFDYN